MKKHLLISILALFITAIALGQNPFITNYTITDGLPSNNCNCVLQDENGFIWFGTNEGAIRYDGTRFKRFTSDDGLSDNTIFRMFEDIEGRVWFLNSNGTVNFFHKNHIFNENEASFLGEISTNFFFHGIFQDLDSTLYFYNSAGEIYVVKNNEYVDYTRLPNINSGLLNISKSNNNHLLIWRKNEVYELEDLNNLIEIHPLNYTCNYAYSQNQFTYISDVTGNIHLFRNALLVKNNLVVTNSRIINDIKVDENYLWVSTFDRGVSCFKADTLFLHLDIAKAQNIIFDKENHIWTTSNIYGGYRINKDILQYQNIGIDEFDNIGLNGIAPATNGGLWLTNGRSLFWFNTNRKEVFSRKISVGGNILDNINQLKDNTLIINGTSTNSYIIKNVSVNEEKNRLDYGELIRLQYPVKKVVIGSDEDKFYSFLNNQFIITHFRNEFETEIKPYNQGRIKNIFLKNSRELVINASTNFIYTPDSTYRDSILSEYDGSFLRSYLNLDEEHALMNINGEKLQIIHDNKIYALLEGIEDQIDFKIEELAYDGNTLFLSTIKTVYFISNPTIISDGGSVTINRLNIEFNNINDLHCDDNNLYVASDDGLTIVPVSECVNTTPTPTKPYFSKVLLDDEEVNLIDDEVSYKNKNRLSIGFSSLNFSSSITNYAYMLEGVNNDWITGTENQVVYLNLKPGKYTFRLKSRKNMEPYSEEIELPITVIPTFFQLLITKIASVLLLLLLGFIAIRSYYRRQLLVREKDNQLVTLENRALQSMMNPHFIFNSLGSIQKYLLQNKPEEAGTYLSQFARLIRQTMNSIKSNSVLLEDEVERLRNYIELEKVRMENRFEFNILIDEKLEDDDYNIPSMIVQPFVENAIWHGISQLQGKGKIAIRFNYVNEKSIEIVIEDNGIGFEKSKAFSKTKNHLNMASTLTQKRIQLIGEKYHVKTKIEFTDLYPEELNPGAKITLLVPIVD